MRQWPDWWEPAPEGLPPWAAAIYEGVNDIRYVDVECGGELHKNLMVVFVREDVDGEEYFMPFWTVNALALKAGVTTGRVRQLLRRRRFPNAFKLNRQWLIPDDDVKAYLAYPDTRRKDVPRQGTLSEVAEGETDVT